MSIWGRNYVHCTKMIVFLTSLSVVGMAMILPLWQAPTTISSECSTGSPDRKSLMKLPKKLPNLRLSLNLEKWVLIFKEKKCWINSNILRSLEVRGLCLMKWPSKMLQKLLLEYVNPLQFLFWTTFIFSFNEWRSSLFWLGPGIYQGNKGSKTKWKAKKIASWVFLAYFEAFHSGYFHQASYFWISFKNKKNM